MDTTNMTAIPETKTRSSSRILIPSTFLVWLTKYLTDVNAQRPTVNTDFDPSQPVAPIKGGKGGKKGTNKK